MIPAATQKDSLLIAPQAMTNSATVTANFDAKGSGHATLRLLFAAEKNTNAVGPTISLLESDDTVVTNFATVQADRTGEDLTAAKEVRFEVDTRKRKRYLRLAVSTPTATNDDITVGAIGSLSRNAEDPDTTTEQGDDVVVAI